MKVISKTDCFIFLLFSFLLSISLSAQEHSECSTMDIPSNLITPDFTKLRSNTPTSTSRASTTNLPIHFIVFREDDGSSVFNFTQSRATDIINKLNSDFANAGFSFYQTGNIQYNDNTYLYNDMDENPYFYNYNSAVINIYIRKGGMPSYANLPWSNNTNSSIISLGEGDAVGQNPITTVTHEMGHYLGLYHTFNGLEQNSPYKHQNNTDRTKFILDRARELVIRSTDTAPETLYPNPNWSYAGDFIEDTPADCEWGLGGDSGCDANFATCEFTGSYTDKNGDPISPALNNFMSYYNSCRTQFTDEQNDAFNDFFAGYRGKTLTSNLGINLVDKIEFEGTNVGISGVNVRLSFPNKITHSTSPIYIPTWSASTSDNSGQIQGQLHDSTVKIDNISKTISEQLVPMSIASGYDWKDGVTAFDMVQIRQYILGTRTFNGYQKLAADVNSSGSVTTFDIVQLRSLILGTTSSFPGQNSPWKFIPEFIPQDNASSFNANPFNANLNYPAYLNPNFTYQISNGLNGKSGFDAIKLGDVNGSNSEASFRNSNESSARNVKKALTIPKEIVEEGEQIMLTFEADNFKDITAYQLGLIIPKDQFQVEGIEKGGLVNNFSIENYKLPTKEDEALRVVWIKENGKAVDLNTNKSLFKIKVKALKSIPDLSKVLSIKDNHLPMRFFKVNGEDADVRITVKLDRLKEKHFSNLISIYPNPVSEAINIIVDLEKASTGMVNIYDTVGKKVFSAEQILQKGRNQIELEDITALPNGTLVVQIETPNKILVGKIVKE